MKKTLVTRVLVGVMLFSLPLVQYKDYSNMLNAEKESIMAENKKEATEDEEEVDLVIPVTFDKSVTKYNSLSLGSIDEVVQSLESAYGVDYTTLISKQRLFNKNVNSRMTLYFSSDDKLKVGVLDDGSILYVEVKELPELQKQVKSFMNGKDNNTGYIYMEDETGFYIKS